MRKIIIVILVLFVLALLIYFQRKEQEIWNNIDNHSEITTDR